MNLRSVTNSTLCAILAGGMCAGALLPATATAKEPKKGKKAQGAEQAVEGKEMNVKAADVAKVTYKGPARVETFSQIGPKRWLSARVVYQEVERDEFSVYLVRNKTNDERVQIDLHTKTVTFSGKGADAAYPILTAAGGTP